MENLVEKAKPIDSGKLINSSKTRRAKGEFPRLTIKAILPLIEMIQELGQGEPVRRTLVFDKMGRSDASGTSRALVIAANSGYGLITGNYNSEKLSLTQLGSQLMTSKTEVDKMSAIYDALWSNKIFETITKQYYDKAIPSIEVVLDTLYEKFGLEKNDGVICWKVIVENLNDQGLIRTTSTGKSLIDSRDEAIRSYGQSEKAQPSEVVPNVIEPELNRSNQTEGCGNKSKMNPTPQIVFNIQVVIPENSDSKTYDAIFSSIARNLLQSGK